MLGRKTPSRAALKRFSTGVGIRKEGLLLEKYAVGSFYWNQDLFALFGAMIGLCKNESQVDINNK